MKKENKHSDKATIRFTDHQLKVLQCWADSATIAEAATKLRISENTMQTLLKRMRKKLGVTRTFDVYRYVKEQGYI